MTISSTTRKAGPFFGNGAATSFPFPFKVFKKQDVLVTLTNASGADTVLVLDSDYTVELNPDQDASPGGQVTYPRAGAPMPSGFRLTLTGGLAYDQPTDIQNTGGFYPQVVEDMSDRSTIQIQQLAEEVARTLKFSVSDPGVGAVLPPADLRANKVLGFDSSGRPVAVVPASGSAAEVAIALNNYIQDVADASDPAKGDALIGVRQPFTGSVARTQHQVNAEQFSVKDAGAVGDGVADDRGAFNLINTAGVSVVVPPGVYRIASNITLTGHYTFMPGAVLKPAAGVIVTLAQAPTAGLYQIFDRSAGGLIQFGSLGTVEVWAEWWGAQPVASKTDNQVAIQQACDAVQCFYTAAPFTAALNNDGLGGVVRLGYCGQYLISREIQITNRCTIRGAGRYTEVKANAATWSGTTMFRFEFGTSSQFFCRLENMSVNAGDIGGIGQAVYAPAWQESCGLRDVMITNYKGFGVFLEKGHGGAVGCVLRDVQLFASAGGTDDFGIYADFSAFTAGYYNLVLDGVTIIGGSSTGVTGRGVSAKGNTRVDVRGLHVGMVNRGVYLETSSVLIGTTLGADVHTQNLIVYGAGWTGFIDLMAAKKGLADNLLISVSGTWTLFKDYEPIFGRLQYPHSPGETVAFSKVTGGTGTPTQAARGFSSISKIGTGLYRLQFDPAKWSSFAGTSYGVKVYPSGIAGFVSFVQTQSTSLVEVQFRDTTGATADCSDFTIEIYGNPNA